MFSYRCLFCTLSWVSELQRKERSSCPMLLMHKLLSLKVVGSRSFPSSCFLPQCFLAANPTAKTPVHQTDRRTTEDENGPTNEAEILVKGSWYAVDVSRAPNSVSCFFSVFLRLWNMTSTRLRSVRNYEEGYPNSRKKDTKTVGDGEVHGEKGRPLRAEEHKQVFWRSLVCSRA